MTQWNESKTEGKVPVQKRYRQQGQKVDGLTKDSSDKISTEHEFYNSFYFFCIIEITQAV